MIEVFDTVGSAGSLIDTTFVCTNSVFLKDYIIKTLMQRLKIERDYCVEVGTEKELKQARGDALVAPIEGKRWLVIIDLDKLKNIEVYKHEARRVNDNSFTLLLCSRYSTYLRVKRDNVLSKANYMLMMYMGSFAKGDISYIATKVNVLSPKLVMYLEKNYRYDVNKVFELFNLLKQGTKVETTQDIVDLIGNGGITPSSIMMDLLVFEPTVKASITRKRKVLLNNLNDLARKMSYSQIYQQMYETLLCVIDIKSLNLNGKYMGYEKTIPEGYDEKRIRKIRRFMYMIPDVSLCRTFYALELFDEKQLNNYVNAEANCLYVILKFLGDWSAKVS